MLKKLGFVFSVVAFISACGDHSADIDGSESGMPAESAFENFFPRHIDIFGVSIRGTAGTRTEKMLHAAHIMAEYLDNDNDGNRDNSLLLQKLNENNATLVMAVDPDELEKFGFRNMPDGVLQDLYAEETLPGELKYGEFDATIEEVLHLITHGGLAYAYPDVFGEAPGTALGDAMDLARGGRSFEIPDPYPDGAWYTYDDETCDYSCMATEYLYWAMTSLLGGQDGAGRLENIDNEWRPNTAEKLRRTDPAVYALLTDPQYSLPTRLPTGNYSGRPIALSVALSDTSDNVQSLSDVIESVDISKTRLQTVNGIEYDIRIFVTAASPDVPVADIAITFPDGRQTRVTREYQRFDDGREHEAGFILDPDSGRAVWSYINIGLTDLAAYGPGDYTVSAQIGGAVRSVVVRFEHPDTEVPLAMPEFPVIMSPADGSHVTAQAVISIEPTDQETYVFLGRLPHEGEAASDFAEEAGGIIPAGEPHSESYPLSPGQWGGDVSTGVQHNGVGNGVEWIVSVAAATEIDLISIAN